MAEAVQSYDAYGNVTALITGAGTDTTWFTADDVLAGNPNVSAIGNPYFYTGQRLDPETGLMYYKNRYYSPQLGRFITRDPIGYKGGSMGLYEYSKSNPTTFMDSHGENPIAWLIVAIGGGALLSGCDDSSACCKSANWYHLPSTNQTTFLAFLKSLRSVSGWLRCHCERMCKNPFVGGNGWGEPGNKYCSGIWIEDRGFPLTGNVTMAGYDKACKKRCEGLSEAEPEDVGVGKKYGDATSDMKSSLGW